MGGALQLVLRPGGLPASAYAALGPLPGATREGVVKGSVLINDNGCRLGKYSIVVATR